MNTIVKLLSKLCYMVGKFVCTGIWKVFKFAWKVGKTGYQEYQKKKSEEVRNSPKSESCNPEIPGPDESVKITAKDTFANLTDDDLQHLLEIMTDNAVKVDGNPELEKIYETYGSDQEILKQEIMDELKRRSQLRNTDFTNFARRVSDTEEVKRNK